MTESEIKEKWYYFCSLAKQFQATEQYVSHSLDDDGKLQNENTFSSEFAKILMLAASEFEVISKALCIESGFEISKNDNIVIITKNILTKYPKIGETIIQTPYKIYKPLKDWKIVLVDTINKASEKVEGLSWWNDYNGVKHNRSQNFTKANLKNCVDAMASLMVLELYLSQTVLNNLDAIKSIGCSYFDCDYGLSYLVVNAGHNLPDFSI